jgi:hypothetical protein
MEEFETILNIIENDINKYYKLMQQETNPKF